MTILRLAVVCVLAWPVVAVAQTHPCDQPLPASQTVGSSAPLKVLACIKPADQPEAFTVYINGVASDLRPLTQVTAPNATGDALYEGPKELQFLKGTYVVEITIWNRPFDGAAVQEGPRSNPLALAVVDDNPPATGRFLGVVR